MPDTVTKVGAKGWSHGWVWNGPGPMPAGAPPQARDASGAAAGKPAAGGHGSGPHGPARSPAKPGGPPADHPAAAAAHPAAKKPAAKPAAGKPAAGKPKKPAAPVKPAPKPPTGGGGQAHDREQAHDLRLRATGLRQEARQLDHEAADLAAGLRNASGRAKKITSSKKPVPKKPANTTTAKKPGKTKPTTSTRITNLRIRAAGLRVQATGLETRAKEILAKKSADSSLNKSDTARRHVATAITDELTYLSFPITKFEKNDEGDIVVIGKATDGSIDSDDQIVDPKWSAKALSAWMETGGNVRVQHQAMRDPAGKGIGVQIDRDGDGGHWVKSLVVEPVAKRLVEKGVLTAYSVGIARPVITRDPTGKARGGIVTGGTLAEISLVDRPANKNCGLMIGKAAAGDRGDLELVGQLFGDPEFLAKASTEQELLTKDAGATLTAGPETAKTVNAPDGQGTDDSSDGDDGDGGQASAQATDADTQDDDGQDGDDAVSKAVNPETAALYKSERAAWLAAEPSVKGIAGGTEYLQKASEWRRWNDTGEAEGLTGTADGAARWLEKRDFSAAQRDTAADAGQAMPDGSFPIKTRGDLDNAIHLAGNAKDPGAARAHIKRRAAALGAEDAIPDTWKVTDTDPDGAKAAAPDGTVGDTGSTFGGGSGKDCPTCKGDGKIMGGQRGCPDCSGKGKVPANFKKNDAADTGEVAEPETVKGSKDCKGCGKSYDADTGFNFCQNCGKKLPGAMSGKKAAHRAEQQASVAALVETVTKSVTAGLISQDAADEVIAQAAAEIGKAKKRPLPGTTAGASMHREPDGSAVEDLEGDAGMPTDKDPAHAAAPGDRVGQIMPGKKSAGPPPYTVGRMHDVLCAAFSPAESLAEYPALKSAADAVDEEWFTTAAQDALTAGKARKASRLTGLLADAQTVRKSDPQAVADAVAHLHKSFTDMYPAAKMSPSEPRKPGSFQRPYLTAGHAAENADHNGGSNIPPSSHTPEPEDFHRPLIEAGHEADSPANKDMDVRNNAPVRTGAARTFYSNAQREAARVAMQNLHDHVAQAFPDLCPMSSSRSVMPPDNGASNVPQIAKPVAHGGVPGVGKTTDMTAGMAPGAQTGPELQALIQGSLDRYAARNGALPLTRKQLKKAAAGMGLDVITKTAAPAAPVEPAVAPAVGLTAAEFKNLLAEQITPLAERYESQITDLRKQLDDIGSQPDPAMAPVRGSLARAPLDKAVPVERRNLVDEAAEVTRKRAADEDAHYREYVSALAKSPDPGVREGAMAVLDKMAS